jgi:hypothetical protein
MTLPQFGQILRLFEIVQGIRPGFYVFLEEGLVTAKLCVVGEDEDGDLCMTDQIMKVHIEFLELFRPVGITID